MKKYKVIIALIILATATLVAPSSLDSGNLWDLNGNYEIWTSYNGIDMPFVTYQKYFVPKDKYKVSRDRITEGSSFERLSNICRALEISFDVVLIEDDRPNAVADDDGILVNTGMLDFFSDEEVMGILLHEKGHIVLNHAGEVEFDSDYQRYLSQKRSHEFAADRFAVMEMIRLGLDPRNFVNALQKLADKYGDSPSEDHPAISARMQSIMELL